MDYETLLQLRETCAGGSNAAKKLANSALKSLRWIETGGEPGDWDSLVDLTDQHQLPIMPFEYATEKGPMGQWGGQYVLWDWRMFMANLSPDQYRYMFADQGIKQFMFRALPFPSPYPALAGYPHFEFTAIRDDGLQVGIHPPGKGGGSADLDLAHRRRAQRSHEAGQEEGGSRKKS